MKAVVFAAGMGTRLRPFTDSHPKALAPIGDTTALGLVVDRLIEVGADGIVVNVHHFAGQVTEWLGARHYAIPIEISDESDLLLDTGGALAKIYRESSIIARASADEAIVVHNADILTDAPVEGLAHVFDESDVSVLVDSTRKSSRRLLFDDNDRMAGWLDEKNGTVKPSGLDPAQYKAAAFGGVHAMRRAVLADISDYCGNELHPFGIIPYYIDRCASLTIRAYKPASLYGWYDIGTPERLATAQQAFTQGLLKL